MALYIPHSIFHLAQLLYVRPETLGPYYVPTTLHGVTSQMTVIFLTYLRENLKSTFLNSYNI